MDPSHFSPTTLAAYATVGALVVAALRYLLKIGILVDGIEKRREVFEQRLDNHETRISHVEGHLGIDP